MQSPQPPTIEQRLQSLEQRLQALELKYRQELDFYRGIQIGDEQSLSYLWQSFLELRKQLLKREE